MKLMTPKDVIEYDNLITENETLRVEAEMLQHQLEFVTEDLVAANKLIKSLKGSFY